MSDLIAQGEEAQQRWRRRLPRGDRVILGRSSGVWAVPWDPRISRRHAELLWDGQQLQVFRLPTARNPVFHRGQESARFAVAPGDHFVIGHTRFTLVQQRVDVAWEAPQPLQQQSFSAQYLKQVQFRNPDYRIEVLSRLPEAISGAAGDQELCVRLVSMLLAGVPRADTAAVVELVRWQPEEAIEGGSADRPGKSPEQTVAILHWDQRTVSDDDFRPSQRLIVEAIEQRQGVLHVWQGRENAENQPFTATGNYDWAFCTPVVDPMAAPASRGGWGLYVAGRFSAEMPTIASSSDPTDLREDLKFTELVGATLSSLRQMRRLERQHANLSQFFSPVVLDTLAVEDPEMVLAPRETEVSVLFCDLRGFSRETERHADDLMELLRRVSRALGVMTRQILDQGGVVGDFQGDAAMGFWGWPLAQDDAVIQTCRAALGIRAEFEAAAREPDSPLAGFHVGLGIATGKAVAGKIGTTDQVKVSVFGPVVNLASRLEGMTKVLRTPILLDRTTADAVRAHVPPETARIRRLAVVRPYGMDIPVEVSELLPPEREYPLLKNEHLEAYEEALEAFLGGSWSEALELLHRVPPQDLVTDFLTVYIGQHNRTPPDDWDGVIALGQK
jgi:adenylate cyclase